MFEPNEKAEIEVFRRKDKSVIIIDNFYKNPDEIRDLAISLKYGDSPELKGGLPGRRASLGTPEVKEKLYDVFLDLAKAYGQLREEDFKWNWDNLGFMVNITKDSYLREDPLGIIPHQDHWDSNVEDIFGFQFGAVVYLNTPDECVGGTNFYSYKGEMSIPGDIEPEWLREAGGKFNLAGPILASLSEDLKFEYVRDKIDGGDPYTVEFEAEMKYNRMVLYPARILHSANVDLGMYVDNYRINQVFFM